MKKIVILLLILLNIGCDQISKKLVQKNIEKNDYIQLLNDNFILTHVENKGAMLGFGESFSPIIKILLLQGLPVLVLLILLFNILQKKNLNIWLLIAFSFVIGGGIGNLIDRIVYGRVTDFFILKIGIFKTGIFNLADLSITIGVLLIFFLSIKHKKLEF